VSEELALGLSQTWRAAWAAATPEAFGACCGVDVFYEDPLAPDPIEGIAPLAAHAERLREAFPDMHVESAGPAVLDGRNGCVPWRFVGTHRGDVGGLPASGRFVTLSGVHYLALDAGSIRRARGFFDVYELAAQLGLLPRRGGLGEQALLLLRGFGLRPRA
jgi:steroid delta-isomerase-like uncharacterized protein